jgi:hypothetical protein
MLMQENWIPVRVLYFLIVFSLTACSNKSGETPHSGSDTLFTAPATNPIGTTLPHSGNCCLVSNTNDAKKLIEVYDPVDTPPGQLPNGPGSQRLR